MKKELIDGLTDRIHLPLEPTDRSYLLIEFPINCNIFNSHEIIYALIGQFNFALREKKEIGVLYDKQINLLDGRFPLYRSYSDARNQLLRIVQNETGIYYSPEKYKTAISALLAVTQKIPVVFGISLSARLTVLALPLVLVFLAFSFYHRVRRIRDKKEMAWPIIHSEGVIENTLSILLRTILVLTSVMLYLTVSLYVSPSAELQGGIDVFEAQVYSTDPVNISSVDTWLAGTKNVYGLFALFMCLVSLACISFSLIVIKKIKTSPVQ